MAASALAEQLQQLGVAAGVSQQRAHGKASLLHTYQEAADIDLETVYEGALEGARRVRWGGGGGGRGRGWGACMACMPVSPPPPPLVARRRAAHPRLPLLRAGFDALCRLDARFRMYSRTLFGAANTAYEREQVTAEVNARLDAAVQGFCHLLSSYFLLEPAFQALEYLVRRFRHAGCTVTLAAAVPQRRRAPQAPLTKCLPARVLAGCTSTMWTR